MNKIILSIFACLAVSMAVSMPVEAQSSQNSCIPPASSVPEYQPPGNITYPENTTYHEGYVLLAQNCRKNYAVYEAAQNLTGVPWHILAGIHNMEGSCSSTKSLVSGRSIGALEPDVGRNCSYQDNGLGKPIPMAGGCGFRSLLDTAVYAGNHLKGKIGKVPNNIQEYAKALGRYNGIGNANCGRVNATMPYCPPPYEGYDHIYPFSKYDAIHEKMYLVYCADYTKCNPPKEYTRAGALVISNILSK